MVIMGLVLSPRVREKLAMKKPPVAQEEIIQCFANRTGKYLLDLREEHHTDPPTQWFISETDYGRKLKIAFIQKNNDIIIKTAYDPNPIEMRMFANFGES